MAGRKSVSTSTSTSYRAPKNGLYATQLRFPIADPLPQKILTIAEP